MKQLIFPTVEHEAYIRNICDICRKNGLSLVLKGSLAKGTGTRYSDIDLLLFGEINEEIMDPIILNYGNPVMTNYTENPPGIMILVYNDLISVDLDIRETLTGEELEEGIVLVQGSGLKVSREILRKTMGTKRIPERPDWYKVLRLVHRSLIKYLSGKPNDAIELAYEARQGLSMDNTIDLCDYKKAIRNLYQTIADRYPIPAEVNLLFQRLLENCEGFTAE